MNTARLIVLVLGTVGVVRADDPDKSGYWLLDPTPRELMRELSPDRPDTTESPITVDAGHLQIEASFADYSHDEEDDQRFEAWHAFDTNVKAGLTNNMDLQFVFAAYGEERTSGRGGPGERLDGCGDLTIRWKTNLWGNDGGTKTAFGVMPFVTIPTGADLSTDRCEGGFIAVLGYDLAEGVGLAFMAEVDAVYDEEDESYDAEFVHTATCGFDVVGPLGAFVEYIGVVSGDATTEYQALFSGGLTYAVNADTLLDVGARFGLTDAAEDVAVFTGITFRY